MTLIGTIAYKEQAQLLNFMISVYIVDSYNGIIQESEEMRPEWFDIDKIPYNLMWKDDRYWLKHLIAKE